MSDKVYNVLFLCTGNSSRSIMAEALLNHLGRGRFNAFSAGSHPVGTVNPLALERLQKEGVFAEGAHSKNWKQFAQADAPSLDFVLTVCDNAAGEVCPVWPGQPIIAHWGVLDPVAVEDEQKFIAFAKAFAILQRRLSLFVNLHPESLGRLALEKKVRDIAKEAAE